ncbi:hypothetical protein BDP55DRAFT_629205 [Colletotrichum godetiae]|uniref:Uncharacterized protein n=1 Tax=Colletotrichum godetiae TaxID=1209918 RepID=A0AAJ0AUT2_9PEZI|nr:uncharacterized protein BDP55DRAFT_629205 [Colletotrichum godetiae]KAK1689240.1 hypothetical protein BDP55DRAFT_629205 [Colletotrichum godetiae]
MIHQQLRKCHKALKYLERSKPEPSRTKWGFLMEAVPLPPNSHEPVLRRGRRTFPLLLIADESGKAGTQSAVPDVSVATCTGLLATRRRRFFDQMVSFMPPLRSGLKAKTNAQKKNQVGDPIWHIRLSVFFFFKISSSMPLMKLQDNHCLNRKTLHGFDTASLPESIEDVTAELMGRKRPTRPLHLLRLLPGVLTSPLFTVPRPTRPGTIVTADDRHWGRRGRRAHPLECPRC